MHTINRYFPPAVFLLFATLITLAPSFDVIFQLDRYDEKRALEVGLLLLTATGIAMSGGISQGCLRIHLALPVISRWLLGGILAAGILSSALAPSVAHALMEVLLFLLLYLFSLFTAAYIQRPENHLLAIFLAAILASALIYEITFFTSYLGSVLQSRPLVLPEPFSGYSSIRFFNQFQIWTLPLISAALALYGHRLPATARRLVLCIAIAWWVLLFASESRGAMLAMAVAFGMTLLAFPGRARTLLRHQALTAAGGLLLYVLLFALGAETLQDVNAQNIANSNGRGALWLDAGQRVLENPLLGIGPMHFAYYPNPASLAHPHSSLIQLAVEWGLPVAGTILLLFLWGCIAWIRAFHRRGANNANKNHYETLYIALFNTLIAGAVYSLVSGVIVMPLSQIMMASVLGLMLGLHLQANPGPQVTTRNNTVLRIFTGGILLLSLLLYVPPIHLRLTADPWIPPPSPIVGPRLWQQGGIPHETATTPDTRDGAS